MLVIWCLCFEKRLSDHRENLSCFCGFLQILTDALIAYISIYGWDVGNDDRLGNSIMLVFSPFEKSFFAFRSTFFLAYWKKCVYLHPKFKPKTSTQ